MVDDGKTDNFKPASDAAADMEGGWNDRNEGTSLSVRVVGRCACGIEAPNRPWDVYDYLRVRTITTPSDSPDCVALSTSVYRKRRRRN